MHISLIAQLLALLAVANTSPLIAKKVLHDHFSRPLDHGLILSDGQPLLGRSKTIRGVLIAVVATTGIAPLVGLKLRDGLIIGMTAMLGDLAASFIKRRMRLRSSSKCTGLDQIPESLLPLMASKLMHTLSVLDIVLATLLFVVGEIILARVCFRLKLRDEPY